jgi:ABC-2 type transport system ATP-binding protein
MEKLLLSATNLSRVTHGQARLTDFNLTLHQGQSIGLLGVNGAGKSTTLALLSGALAPTSGIVEVSGVDLHKHSQAKHGIGILPEKPPLYPNLSVSENLAFAAGLRGLSGKNLRNAISRMIDQMDLYTNRKRLCRHLSKGMAQRVAIAQALIHAPDILILDEPTAGLDPAQAQAFRQLIKEQQENCGIIIASHILADIEQLCDQVTILNQGRQVASHNLSDSHLVRIKLAAPPSETIELERLSSVAGVQHQDHGWYQLELQQPEQHLAQEIISAGWQLQALIPAQQNLQQLLTEAISHSEAVS